MASATNCSLMHCCSDGQTIAALETTGLLVQSELEGKTYRTIGDSRWKQKREKKGRSLTQEVSREERTNSHHSFYFSDAQ